MYKWIKPMSVIPVHGEQRHMLEHIKFAKEMSVPYPIKVRMEILLDYIQANLQRFMIKPHMEKY